MSKQRKKTQETQEQPLVEPAAAQSELPVVQMPIEPTASAAENPSPEQLQVEPDAEVSSDHTEGVDESGRQYMRTRSIVTGNWITTYLT